MRVTNSPKVGMMVRTGGFMNIRQLAFALGNGVLLLPAQAAAQSVRTPSKLRGTEFTNIADAITAFFNIAITVAGVVFVLLFLIGGIQYLAAAGNEDNTNKAKKLLVDAVVGLVIVIVSWAVGTYVLSLLGIGEPGQLDLEVQ